jgi:hypothetical protein
MDRVGSAAIKKLAVTVAVAILLLVLYRLWPDGPLSGVAIGGFALVAGPIFILVLIDTGRTLRRHHLGRAATLATWLPQVVLGTVACFAGMGALGLAAFSQAASFIWRLWATVAALGVLSYGLHLLKGAAAGDN